MKLARHCPLMGPRGLNHRPNSKSSTDHATIPPTISGFLSTSFRG